MIALTTRPPEVQGSGALAFLQPGIVQNRRLFIPVPPETTGGLVRQTKRSRGQGAQHMSGATYILATLCLRLSIDTTCPASTIAVRPEASALEGGAGETPAVPAYSQRSAIIGSTLVARRAGM